MNILRNPGFERGNTSFWQPLPDSTLVIDGTEHYSGAYSGAVTANKVGNVGATHDDYIKIDKSGIIRTHARIKAVAGRNIWIRVNHYDTDLNYLGSQSAVVVVSTGGWDEVVLYYNTRLWAAYAKIYIYYTSTALDEVFYIDGGYAEILTEEYLGYLGIQVANVVNAVASGDTSATPVPFIGHTKYYADITCTSITGTAPTMQVSVCELDQYSNEVVLGEFTLLAAIGSERIDLTPSIGRGLYVKYVKGGIMTDCDFKVFVTGLR